MRSRTERDGNDAGRAPSGFTLVELLVVIVIIALLAALVTPAVMRARNSARNAAVKAEIDMLHMAIMNYKNEYGSFPPAFSPPVAGSPSAKHLQRLFPRCTTVVNELGSRTITPNVALTTWLKGFTDNPMLPVTGGARKKLFDFDESRISADQYAPAGKPGSPYIYIDSASYGSGPWSLTGGTYYLHRLPNASGAMNDPTQQAFNPDTFQILCAGQDEEFGTDDDLSNFWKGTRKEYLDSLKQ